MTHEQLENDSTKRACRVNVKKGHRKARDDFADFRKVLLQDRRYEIELSRLRCKDSLLQQVPLLLLVGIPSVNMLTDHNAIKTHGPHLCGAMPTGLELVIDFLSLIRTLN